MPPLERTRAGWNAERLAEFLLAKTAFISAPTSVADDIGIDFACTLFRRLPGQHTQLLPTLPFVVQVKASHGIVRLTKNIPLLLTLQVPMFVAISEVQSGKLTLYSARYLRFAFDYKGRPTALSGALCSGSPRAEAAVRVTRQQPLGLRVDLIRIASWSVRSGREHLDRVRRRLETECFETALNNYHSAANQYLFRFSRPSHTRVLAGSGSASQFRRVMADRLAEYARNLQWLRSTRGRPLTTETRAFLEAATLLRPFIPAAPHLLKAVKALGDHAV